MGLLSQLENKSNKPVTSSNTVVKKEEVEDFPSKAPEGIPVKDKNHVCFEEYFIDVQN